MDEDELQKQDTEEAGAQKPQDVPKEELPAGIARLHEEWREQGLIQVDPPATPTVELEPVVFPEPVGDYRVAAEDARTRLGLSEEAMERVLACGELDSIQVRFADGVRRMVSESALSRFAADSGMDASLSEGLGPPSQEVISALETIRAEVEEIRELQARQLQQFKDVLLLELRNLKEQDRDLTSFIYDLTEALEELYPKLRRRKRTTPEQERGTRSEES